jgi:hypothetical protein
MSKLLLLVQSEADVAHLDAAAKAILNSAITGVWCVFSPAVTVDATEAASKLDAEIAQLKSAERQAADREDYTAAAGYKQQREGKELDRAKALRDAWKTAPAEDRKAKMNAIFKPFLAQLQPAGVNVKVSAHSDHYDREQWVAMLNSLSGVWFKEFSAGGFGVHWPESIAASVKHRISFSGLDPEEPAPNVTIRDPLAQAKPAERLPQVPKVTLTREAELSALRHFGLVAVAKKLGITYAGMNKPDIITAIIAAEKPAPTPVPEAVETY